jgi:ribonuclease D
MNFTIEKEVFLKGLGRIQGMNEAQVRRHGARLLEAVGRGLNNPPLYPPRQERPSEAFMKRLETLRHWRKTAGEQMGVGSDVILPRDLMHTLAEKNPQTAEELAQILCDVPWRREHFGEEILQALSKRKK